MGLFRGNRFEVSMTVVLFAWSRHRTGDGRCLVLADPAGAGLEC